jgi:predicted pyridoxine 5'-phosphate oxidase superfamily flavin-nucleotide-binding protein
MSMPLHPEASPFHAGERAAQERVGVRQVMERHGRQVIRDAMPDQHRRFFEQLPFVVVGSVDHRGQPWSSLLAPGPGFLSSPDSRHLVVRARPPAGDPLAGNLVLGAEIGLLGIDPATRRRNRVNGVVEGVGEGGFVVAVRQSFGNCPRYIQARTVAVDPTVRPGPAQRNERLQGTVARLVDGADTFYLASTARGPGGGTDVSHRGGRPGFVLVGDGGRTLIVPDYPGNNYFNTIGNLLAHPRAGLLFVDFERGDLVQVAARAEVVWDGPEVHELPGAERLLRFTVSEVIHLPGAVPLRWGAPRLSPFLEDLE